MNILLFNWQDRTHPLGGGAEVHYHEIFKRLVHRGHRVTLFCSSYDGAPKEEEIDGIRVIRAGGRQTFNFEVFRRYRSLSAQEPFDIVVDDLNKIPFFTPLFIQKPLLTIVHHLFGTSIFKEAAFPAATYVWGAEKAALPVYRKGIFAAVSESTKTELIQHGIRPENIHLVMNAVDPDLYAPSHRPVETGPVVGYVGRIKQYKSVDHLLKAFAAVLQKIPEARLIIVGDGDAKPGLERLSHSLGIAGAVTFTGFVDETEKVDYLRKCSIVINPSAKEGWGLTVIEANACGVPVIASDVPGLRDSVRPDETGILYPYGHIERLATEAINLMNDPARRATLAKNAFQWSERFTWDASADAMEKAMDAALAFSGK
jgi:glycosyltransferase involved in cell wall biosynthesis